MPATVSVANTGGGTLGAPVVTMEPGVDAWLAASAVASGRDSYALTLRPTAYPPVQPGGAVETTVMILDPGGVASAMPVRVRFDALASDLGTATVRPSPLTIWAQVGMGDPAPRTISLRTPAGCFSAPAVSVASADGLDPASWVSVGAVASSAHGHHVSVLTSAAGLGDGDVRAATLHLSVPGKAWDVPVNLAAGSLAPAGPETLPASGRVLTPLADGRVLTTGGSAGTVLFDPSTRTWTTLTEAGQGRVAHGAVELEDGRILVCGGYDPVDGKDISTCELGSWSSSPKLSMTWSSLGSLTKPRKYSVKLVEMPRRRVLVASSGARNEAPEILDLDTGRSTVLTGVFGTAAVKRPDGSILVAGGSGKSWLYRPELDAWAPAGDLVWDHARPALMPLPDGRVMALGGGVWSWGLSNSVNFEEANTQLWNPRTNTWTRGPESPNFHPSTGSITLLSSGKILATDGMSLSAYGITDLEVFDPVTGKWSVVGKWASSRAVTSIVRLSTGMVLFTNVGYVDAQNRAIFAAETYTW